MASLSVVFLSRFSQAAPNQHAAKHEIDDYQFDKRARTIQIKEDLFKGREEQQGSAKHQKKSPQCQNNESDVFIDLHNFLRSWLQVEPN